MTPKRKSPSGGHRDRIRTEWCWQHAIYSRVFIIPFPSPAQSPDSVSIPGYASWAVSHLFWTLFTASDVFSPDRYAVAPRTIYGSANLAVRSCPRPRCAVIYLGTRFNPGEEDSRAAWARLSDVPIILVLMLQQPHLRVTKRHHDMARSPSATSKRRHYHSSVLTRSSWYRTLPYTRLPD